MYTPAQSLSTAGNDMHNSPCTMPCFRRRRTHLVIITLLAVCTGLAKWSFSAARVKTNLTEQTHTTIPENRIYTFQQIHPTKKGNPEDIPRPRWIIPRFSLRPAHPTKKASPGDILGSAIYISKKTSFMDVFPPNTKTALTVDADFVIGNFNMCADVDHVTYIVVVHSAVKYTARRQTIRDTWGKRDLIHGSPSRTIFLVGQSRDKMAQLKLLKENDLHRDIIQGQFADTHRNLTLKNVMGLRWLSKYCSNSKYVLKVDDDVFVDIFRAKELYFDNLESSPKQIICDVGTNNSIFREEDFPVLVSSRMSCVSNDYFRMFRRYPMPWCFGFAVFMSMDLARELYQAALVTPAYPLDDVYVYGILASTVKGVTWRNEGGWFSKGAKETMFNWGCSHQHSFIVGTFKSASSAQKLWNSTLGCSPE